MWHTRLAKLLVAGDDGDVALMSADGSDVALYYPGGDLEGITVANPDSSFVYLGVETGGTSATPNMIKEFDLDADLVTRSFSLYAFMTAPINSGLEALTFVPDATSDEGGYFYAGQQSDGTIYVFSLPIKSSSTSTTVTFVDSFTPVSGRTDIAGLHYDADADNLYVLYDNANKIRILDADGNYQAEWTAPGTNQEGIALGPDCEIYIAQDSGGVILYE